jgi:N-acetylglutamate synthase-like GNAT family acetyltransferase
MSSPSTREVRAYLAGLSLANEFEIEELRKTAVELKLRQLWALMTSADFFEKEGRRETEASKVRERWSRLHRALHG